MKRVLKSKEGNICSQTIVQQSNTKCQVVREECKYYGSNSKQISKYAEMPSLFQEPMKLESCLIQMYNMFGGNCVC